MRNKLFANVSWGFASLVVGLVFFVLQIARWRILPQFMDIYYHLHTAWGFLQAGGYSGWDFWEYAPYGRVHIYPPLFHIILALLFKLGANKLILAKLVETLAPVGFLSVLWYFTRKHYGERFAFFAMLFGVSSFSFYMSLMNHLPATLAIILGILAFGQILSRKFLRAVLLLAACFYMHIGISWMFAIAVFLYALFNKDSRKFCLMVFLCALAVSLPVLITQLLGSRHIARIGINLNERFTCQFKIFEYIAAGFGVFVCLSSEKKYRLFPALFFASIIFLAYPYRFFSAEGYLPVILLSAAALDSAWIGLRSKTRYLKTVFLLGVAGYVFVISPTIITSKPETEDKTRFRLVIGHSALRGMIFPEDEKKGFFSYLWLAYRTDDFLSSADIVRKNSGADEIIYCNTNLLGVWLGVFSGRATANGLFPEINAARSYDPFLASGIIVLGKNTAPEEITKIEEYYKLARFAENELFIFYKNPQAFGRMRHRGSSFPFWAILTAACIVIWVFLQKGRKHKKSKKTFDIK